MTEARGTARSAPRFAVDAQAGQPPPDGESSLFAPPHVVKQRVIEISCRLEAWPEVSGARPLRSESSVERS